MKDTFALVGRRSIAHNKVDWEHHFIVTKRRHPTHIVLNAQKLKELSTEEQAILFSELVAFIS